MNTPPGGSSAPAASATRRRKPNNLHKLSRSPIIGRFAVVNHFNRVVDKLARTAKYPRASAFLSTAIFQWVWSYLKYVFERKFPFPTYANSRKSGVYRLSPRAGADALHVAIAGDWGTGTEDAERVGRLMQKGEPDVTIHLGDVYYVGDREEIDENCLGKAANGYDGVNWPRGTQGSFALNGNHEMYANGKPYFTHFLKTLGSKGDEEGQVASYFCLEAGGWRILGIDTGYNSVGIPILGMIPGLREIPAIGGDCHLEEGLLEWLRNVVRPRENPKPTLLLSHHQYFSAFPEQSYHKPAQQLAEFFRGQELVWLWGHEHRLGIYNKFTTAEGLGFYGRCIGHGGMPVEMAEPDDSKAPLALYDTRTHQLSDGTIVGQNGYVSATIRDASLTLDYRDIDDVSLLVERFELDGQGRLVCSLDDRGILKRL